MLIIAILCATDKQNGPPSGLVPLVLFFSVLGIGLGLGMETGYAINPARDFGPRLLTAMVGYGRAGKSLHLIVAVYLFSPVFDFRHQYWIWCPILGPILGMQIGALTYDLLVYNGGDSIVNKPYVREMTCRAFWMTDIYVRRDVEAERRHLNECTQHKRGGAEAV